MRNLSLGIDIDGTLTEPYYWLADANRHFNTNIRPEQVTDYAIHKVMGVERKAYEAFYRIYAEKIHRQARMRPGVREVLNRFSKQHEIHVITAREEKMSGVTMDWLKENRLPMDSLALLGSIDKVDRARKMKCDIFVEDSYENALMLAKASIPVLLIDCSYNRGILPEGVIRVKNWNQIKNHIERAQQ